MHKQRESPKIKIDLLIKDVCYWGGNAEKKLKHSEQTLEKNFGVTTYPNIFVRAGKHHPGNNGASTMKSLKEHDHFE